MGVCFLGNKVIYRKIRNWLNLGKIIDVFFFLMIDVVEIKGGRVYYGESRREGEV